MGKLELVQTVKQDNGRVWNVSWHPKGETFASCGEENPIRIWGKDLTGKWRNTMVLAEAPKLPIRQAAWSPCGNYLDLASFDARKSIRHKKSGKFEGNASLEDHENEVKNVAWSKSGATIVKGPTAATWIWEVADEDCAAVLKPHLRDVKKVIFHPERDLLASASYDNAIILLREELSNEIWVSYGTLRGHDSTVWGISFDGKGKRLASCSADQTVKIWKEYPPGNPEGVATVDGDSTWKCVCTLTGHHGRTIYDITWCPKTGLIATASGGNAIRVFKENEISDPNAPTFDLVCTVDRAHNQDVNCVAWNPAISGLLMSCSYDGEIKLWNFKDA